MRFNTRMPASIKGYYLAELAAYKRCHVEGEYERGWKFLERAHILGQSYPIEHSQIHWLMLKEGFRRKSIKEVSGQVLRLMTGGLKSFVNRVPTGNTGKCSSVEANGNSRGFKEDTGGEA